MTLRSLEQERMDIIKENAKYTPEDMEWWKNVGREFQIERDQWKYKWMDKCEESEQLKKEIVRLKVKIFDLQEGKE